MPPVDRNKPVRAKSSESSYSLMEFMREFPNDEACLEHLWRSRYSTDGEHAFCERCDKERSFKRYANKTRTRQVWTCTSCSLQIAPTAGTIFHKSSTSLHLWFYAIWIITSTRCGVSAKQLERELGVTYKTAWRMFNLIRNKLMVQDYQGPLSGEVEADETFVGGKPRQSFRNEMARQGVPMQTAHWDRKAVVFGAVERKGKIRAEVVPTSRGHVVRGKVHEYVLPESTIYTDDYKGYLKLGGGSYTHRRINHSARVYVDGDVHTQTIEGFFGLFKNGVRGVYHSVSKKWLQGYVNEYVWRYNHRDDRESMFRILLQRAATSS
jgi:transposase